MACNSKMVGVGAARSEKWGTETLVTHICCIFGLVVFAVILGQFDAHVSEWHLTRKWLAIKPNEVNFETRLPFEPISKVIFRLYIVAPLIVVNTVLWSFGTLVSKLIWWNICVMHQVTYLTAVLKHNVKVRGPRLCILFNEGVESTVRRDEGITPKWNVLLAYAAVGKSLGVTQNDERNTPNNSIRLLCWKVMGKNSVLCEPCVNWTMRVLPVPIAVSHPWYRRLFTLLFCFLAIPLVISRTQVCCTSSPWLPQERSEAEVEFFAPKIEKVRLSVPQCLNEVLDIHRDKFPRGYVKSPTHVNYSNWLVLLYF